MPTERDTFTTEMFPQDTHEQEIPGFPLALENGHAEAGHAEGVSGIEEVFGTQEAQFSDTPIDIKDTQKRVNESLAPSGIYLTCPGEFGPMTLFKPTQYFGETRRMITLSGKVRGRIKGTEITTFFRNAQLSPEHWKRKKWEDGKVVPGQFEDKPDQPTVLWDKAVLAYYKTFKEAPSENGLIAWLTDGEYKVKLGARNGEIRVYDILPLKG